MDFYTHLNSFLDTKVVENIKKSIQMEETHCLRFNTLKDSFVLEELKEGRGVCLHPYIQDALLYDKTIYEFGKSILFYAGAFYIQDPAAMMAVYLLNVKPNEKILDMCAAPGGKSYDALLDLKDEGLLVCNDIHDIRCKILSSNIEKYGFKNVIVLNDSSKKYKVKFLQFFDKIILDAPCSGSAMFRKNSEALKQWSLEKVYDCQVIQKELIEDAYEMLAPGGKLLYSTCSFSIQENEEVIRDFLNKHEDMEIEPIKLNQLYSDTINLQGGIRLYPYQFNGEGQVIFILKKKIGESSSKNKVKIFNSVIVPKVVKDFLNSIYFECNTKNIVLFKNHYYLADFEKINLNGIGVQRYGLDLGEVIKDRFEPSHALAMYHQIDKRNFIELNDEEALNYLKGLDVYKEGSSGYRIVAYKGFALGWVKHVNNQLKNHYPKGLRIKF